jgi:hypothetical protein
MLVKLTGQGVTQISDYRLRRRSFTGLPCLSSSSAGLAKYSI